MAASRSRPSPAPAPARAPAAATSAPDPLVADALRIVLPCVVAVLAFLAFLPALSQGFVLLDDDRNFIDNPAYRGLSGKHLEWMFTANHMGHYQPLSWVTLALDYHMWGAELGSGKGYHLTNMLLHAGGSVLLYLVALRLLQFVRPTASILSLRLCAAAGALLHAVHPLRVESVAWATERRDVLSALFLLASVLAYLRMVRTPGRPWTWLAAAVGFYVLSLFSKAWGITLPAVLLVLDAGPLRASTERVGWRRVLLEKLAFAPLAILFAALAAKAQGEVLAVVSLEEHGILQRAAQASYGLMFYPWKTLWPSGLSAMYLLERELDPSRPVYVASMVGVVVVSLGLLLAARRFRWARACLAAWVVYAILASPVLGLLQSGSQKVADRYTHLAAIPFALLAAGGLLVLAERLRSARGGRSALLALGLPTAALVALLCGLSVAQTRVWASSESLFRRMVEVEPDNYFARHVLSVTLYQGGQFEEAFEHSQASVAAHPFKGNEEARYMLGLLHKRAGRHAEAIEAFRGAFAVAPDHKKSIEQLEAECARSGDPDCARKLYEQAVQGAPGFAEGWVALARLTQPAGPAAVQAVWKRAAAALPKWAMPRHSLGLIELEQGRPKDAEIQLLAALQMESHSWPTMTALGRAYWAQGRKEEAKRMWRLSEAADPQARALLQQAR